MPERWQLKGTVFVACNCDYGCPCNFNAPPTAGYCEGQWTWHVDEGRAGETPLDGLNFTVAVKWPGAIHEGNGEALILVDERAEDAQREAIAALVGGDVGGPWGVLAWTWPTVHGPHPAAYELELAGVTSRVKAGEAMELELEPIRNPVSGAEVHPAGVLPEGIVFKQADFASSKLFRVDDGIAYDHSGKYTAVGPFDYAGP
jgi:hypothetical protein